MCFSLPLKTKQNPAILKPEVFPVELSVNFETQTQEATSLRIYYYMWKVNLLTSIQSIETVIGKSESNEWFSVWSADQMRQHPPRNLLETHILALKPDPLNQKFCTLYFKKPSTTKY